jgi:hypothetical protein
MSDYTWVPGTVMSANGRERIEAGQKWGLALADSNIVALQFSVVSVSKEGEVMLRPFDDEETRKAAQIFPPSTGFVKGVPSVCPFKQGKDGTFSAHEAWSLWKDMVLETR